MNWTNSNTNNANLTPVDYKNIGLAQLIPATVSLLCSLLTLILALLLKQYKEGTHKLVLYLFIGEFLNSIAYLLKGIFHNKVDDSIFCKAIAYYNQFTSSCILAAICCIIIDLFVKTIVHKRCRCQWLYLLLIFLLPLGTSALPFIHDAYGNAGLWCWIRATNHTTGEIWVIGAIYQYSLWYVPLYTLLIAGGVIYALSYIKLYRELKESETIYTSHNKKLKRRKALQELTAFKWYPIIYCAVNIFSLATRIDEQVNPKKYHIVLWIITGAILSLQGLFFMIGFLASPTVRRLLAPRKIKHALQALGSKSSMDVNTDGPEENTPLSGRSAASSAQSSYNGEEETQRVPHAISHT